MPGTSTRLFAHTCAWQAYLFLASADVSSTLNVYSTYDTMMTWCRSDQTVFNVASDYHSVMAGKLCIMHPLADTYCCDQHCMWYCLMQQYHIQRDWRHSPICARAHTHTHTHTHTLAHTHIKHSLLHVSKIKCSWSSSNTGYQNKQQQKQTCGK